MAGDTTNNNPSPGLPPFIPGLLIVSLLIIMSVLVAWRNWLRRNRLPTHVDAVGPEWPTRWEETAIGTTRGRGKKLEKPKLWDIDILPTKDVSMMKGSRWEDIMPLSITSLDAKLSIDTIQDFKGPPVMIETTPVYLNSRNNSTLPFQLPRLPFFSRTRTSDTAPTDDVDPNLHKYTPESNSTMSTTSNIQISVMISMPSPYNRISYRGDDGDDDDDIGTRMISEKAPMHTEFLEFAEGVPEVAFGVAVVPLQPNDFSSVDKEK